MEFYDQFQLRETQLMPDFVIFDQKAINKLYKEFRSYVNHNFVVDGFILQYILDIVITLGA